MYLGIKSWEKDGASEYIIKEKAKYLGTKSWKIFASGDIFGENAIKKIDHHV